MTLYERMREEHARLEKETLQFQEKMEGLPDGKLICCQGEGNTYKWYVSDGHEKVYLPKKDRRKAELLAKKKLYQAMVDDNVAEMRAIDYYLSHHRLDYCKQERVMDDEGMRQLLEGHYGNISEELEAWANADYIKSDKYPELLIHKTLSGHMVRSKSEVMIANAFYMHGIPFRYEAKAIIGGVELYPDFEARRPYDGKIYYWEHFGMMDSPQYVESCMRKMNLYVENGYVPSLNFIVTYETATHPLDCELVEKMIEYYL